MLWFYKEKKYLLISLIALILDGIIIYNVPSFFNKLDYLYPMLTVSIIPFLASDSKKMYLIIILGFLYDLLYTNIFLYNALLFLILFFINKKIIKYFNNSIFLYTLLVVLNIIIYDSITFFMVVITGYQSVNLNDLLYKIKHSLLLNIMSVFGYCFIFKKKKMKHKM